MSTKTTFKRIALVAVAALGLGVISVAPSSATVSALTITSAAGTATTATSDSSTAGTYSVQFYQSAATDSVTLQIALKSVPTGADVTIKPQLMFIDTMTSVVTTTVAGARGDSTTAIASSPALSIVAAGANTYAGANYKVILDTATVGATARTNVVLKAGTYVATVIATPSTSTTAGTVYGTPTYTDISIVVSDVASASKTASAVYSTLSDPSPTSKVATVSSTNTAASTMTVTLKNSENADAARESVTATITGPGTIGVAGGSIGKSVVLPYSSTSLTLSIYADGTAGTSTINVSTPSVTFATKSITFFSKAAKSITASVKTPVLAVGANTYAVAASAVDANGVAWTGAAYIYADSASALVAGNAVTPVACTYDATDAVHYCPVTAIAGGTAKLKVIDAATVALATATSNEVTVTVNAKAVASVKLAFDKSTYAPFEKASITVTPVDSSGNALSAQAAAAFLASGGITSTYAFSAGSDTLTADTFATSYLTGAKTYTVYMPAASGEVKITATGGTALPVAAQVAVSATATIVNSSVDAATDAANEATDAANAATDAALAAADAADAATAAAQDASDAVAALSATVAKLVASLKAQITSLTNLVIKIQKKVKA